MLFFMVFMWLVILLLNFKQLFMVIMVIINSNMQHIIINKQVIIIKLIIKQLLLQPFLIQPSSFFKLQIWLHQLLLKLYQHRHKLLLLSNTMKVQLYKCLHNHHNNLNHNNNHNNNRMISMCNNHNNIYNHYN